LKEEEMPEYYSYLYLRIDGTPYYVGKGTGYRAYTKHLFVQVPAKDRIVIYPAASEDDAYETEIALIWYYGRKDLGTGCLHNLTDGGEGGKPMLGRHHSLATIQKMSAVHTANPSLGFKGKEWKPESKEKLSTAVKLWWENLSQECLEEQLENCAKGGVAVWKVEANRLKRAESIRARAAKITHCPHGHEYTEENTWYNTKKNGNKSRRCRECVYIYRRGRKTNGYRNGTQEEK
jgi:hypothetical protein